MDYENKYNEAVEKARVINSGKYVDIPAEDTVLEYIFPELKESEDERIRKEIISVLKNANYKGVYDKHLAWIEKQGEPTEINPTEFDTRLQALIGKFDSLPKEELIASLSFWLNVVHNDGTYKEEKQGEKPQGKSALEAINEVEGGNRYGIYDTLFEDESITTAIKDFTPKQGEKSINDTDEEIVEAVKDTSVLDMVEQKPIKWSEEDQNILEDIEEAVINYWHGDTVDMITSWLDSLKERIKL